MRHGDAGHRRAGFGTAPTGFVTLAALVSLVSLPVAAGAQAAAAAAACEAPADGIRIIGAVEQPVTLTRTDMLAMDPVTVEVTGHDGAVHSYRGPTLRAVLDRAGVPGGADLEGHLDGFVVVEARDGYRVTFALAELDGGYWDRLPILALRRDGRSLADDEHAGPFQVIAPDTPKHGRWARQVACLRVAYPDW